MKKGYLLMLTLFFTSFSAQKKDNCNDIENRYKDAFERYKDKSLTREKVLKCIQKNENYIKIEIINNGNIEDLRQIIGLKIVKSADKKDTIALENYQNYALELEKSIRDDIKNWTGGENNSLNIHFEDILDHIKIHQKYHSIIEETSKNRAVKDVETYKIIIPISELSMKIYSHTDKLDVWDNSLKNITKTINIYVNDKLEKTQTYSFEEIIQTEGINILVNMKEYK